jgi:hypothetical protein
VILDQLKEISGWLVAIAAGAGALGWLIRKIWKAFKKIDRLIELAELVEKEMRPNGGNSLRDKVNEVHTKLDSHLNEHAKAPVQMIVNQAPAAAPHDGGQSG